MQGKSNEKYLTEWKQKICVLESLFLEIKIINQAKIDE